MVTLVSSMFPLVLLQLEKFKCIKGVGRMDSKRGGSNRCKGEISPFSSMGIRSRGSLWLVSEGNLMGGAKWKGEVIRPHDLPDSPGVPSPA